MPCLFTSTIVSKIRSTKIGASPIDGSSRRSSFGRAMSARPIAHICCSPPDIVPAFCVRRSWSRGKSSKTRSMSLGEVLLVGALERAHLEVLRAPSCAGRAAAPPGSGRSRFFTIACGSDCVMSAPSKRIVPCRGWFRPLIARSVVDLPGAVRADQRDDLACLDPERDALQRVDRAVVDVDVVELEDVARRRLLAHSVAPLAEVRLDHALVRR